MRRKAILWIVVFAMIFASPFITYSFLEQYLDSANYENREITEKPVLTRENFASYPEEYELYFNDNIPYRNQLVRLNSGLDFFAFHDSASENVVIGKNGWLFYTGPGNPVEQSTGKTALTDGDLAVLAGRLMLVKNYMEAQGTEFVFFIAPNKESIYTEELPDCYPVAADYTEVMQLVDYLRENTDIRVVWPYEELLKAKEDSGLYLYSHFDTHWGNTGAYVGAKALAKELGIEMPVLTALSVEGVLVSSGDLARMLNLTVPNGDVEYNIEGYEVSDGNEGASFMEFHNAEGDARTLVMRRDSFGARLSKVLQHEFQDMYVSQSKNDTDREADIFVYEIVERNIRDIFVELDYAAFDVSMGDGVKTITVKAPDGLEYPYVSIFKNLQDSEEWETVQVASPLSNTQIEVPEDESGHLEIYFLGDEDGEIIVYEDAFYY